jgi:hypothetical protein
MIERHTKLIRAAVGCALLAIAGGAIGQTGPATTPSDRAPAVRGDNPNLPNPVTPSAANESAPQPRVKEPTNASGMEGRAPTGATAGETKRSGSSSPADPKARTAAPAGTSAPTLPARSDPASVSESAPQRTGKEVTAAPVTDSKNTPNPKTPANVSESAPDKAGKEQRGVGATR